MKKIVISGLSLIDQQVTIQLNIDGVDEVIYARLSQNIVPYATLDRIDSVVMGLILFAIKNGYDFDSAIPITDELYYNLTTHLIEAIASTENLHRPEIRAPKISACDKKAHIVSTGVSCGVDSLYTICFHKTNIPPSHQLTHLSFFNVGSHHTGQREEKSRRLFEERRKHIKSYCEKSAFELIEIESNLYTILDKYDGGCSHIEYHTYMALFCILLIQKGVSKYYYSSGHMYAHFDCKYRKNRNFDSASYDLLTLCVATSSNISFSSFGATVTRLKKIEFVAKHPLEAAHLNVCVLSPHNEGTCFKCRRTLLEIDFLGMLENFKDAFDIKQYMENRNDYLEYLYIGVLRKDPFCEDIISRFNSEIGCIFKMKVVCKKLFSMCKNKILK